MTSGSPTRPVEVVIDVPVDLVEDVEDVREADPEFLGRVIRYALTRRIVFEELSTKTGSALQ
jgi:hypothetical protein